MSITGIIDIDKKICLLVNMSDIVNVMFINYQIKNLIINNIEEYIKNICEEYYNNTILRLNFIDYYMHGDDEMLYDIQNFDYCNIVNLVVKLLKLDEARLANKVINCFNLIDNSDLYLLIYGSISCTIPEDLNPQILKSFFIIFPNNYHENKLMNLNIHDKTIYNLLEFVYNKGFYKVTEKFLHYCSKSRNKSVFDEHYGNKAIQLKRLISKIKISIELNNLIDLTSDNGTIISNIREQIKLL